MEKPYRIVFYIAGGAVLLSFPLLLNRYCIYVLDIMGFSLILCLGLNLVMGFAGQISLGHAAFAAIGAYTTGLLKMKLGVPFWVGWPIGAILSSIVGFGLGLPALRLRGHYLALATLGFGVSTQLIIFRWESLTNGPRGFLMTPVSIFSLELVTEKRVYYLILVTTFLLFLLARNIVNSKTGRAFLALRDSEIGSQSLGINLAKYKTLAFTLSAFYAGIAGGLYAALMQYICADNFGIWDSVAYVTTIVIGGFASLPGTIIGVVLLTIFQELMRDLLEFQGLVYGLVVILFIIFMPRGIAGLLSDLKLRIKTTWFNPKQLGIKEE